MNEQQWIVRVYDFMDHYWVDCFGSASREECETYYNKVTDNGTKMTKFSDGDYYAIFPSDTHMIINGTRDEYKYKS